MNRPRPRASPDPARRASLERARAYLGLTPGTSITEVKVDRVFTAPIFTGLATDPVRPSEARRAGNAGSRPRILSGKE